MSYPKLTPEHWAQIPPEYVWFAIDLHGSRYAYTEMPEPNGVAVWIIHGGSDYFLGIGADCPEWESTLQQRPAISQTEIKETGTAVLSDILAQEGFKSETTPNPSITHVRLSMADFERIAKDFNLNVRHCETYCDAAMYNPAGQIAIVFVADVPVESESGFDDTGAEYLVRTFEKIKLT